MKESPMPLIALGALLYVVVWLLAGLGVLAKVLWSLSSGSLEAVCVATIVAVAGGAYLVWPRQRPLPNSIFF